jgi:hypothetical protein
MQRSVIPDSPLFWSKMSLPSLTDQLEMFVTLRKRATKRAAGACSGRSRQSAWRRQASRNRIRFDRANRGAIF